ncbi:MAG: hypothetical protein CVU41_19235 [Chloroflexi bacterium HGW-Chloroflexi-3]|nr:MAG: hypothetical protein CVU41_19235 [Chloroflexi bacterium HGW-Chloroflexi-3]
MKWFDKIFKRKQATSLQSSAMGISPQHAKNMLMMIEKTQEKELSCDEVHALLDQYAEMALRGEDTAELLPLVHYHLVMCPDCKEEYEALTRILQAPIEN